MCQSAEAENARDEVDGANRRSVAPVDGDDMCLIVVGIDKGSSQGQPRRRGDRRRARSEHKVARRRVQLGDGDVVAVSAVVGDLEDEPRSGRESRALGKPRERTVDRIGALVVEDDERVFNRWSVSRKGVDLKRSAQVDVSIYAEDVIRRPDIDLQNAAPRLRVIAKQVHRRRRARAAWRHQTVIRQRRIECPGARERAAIEVDWRRRRRCSRLWRSRIDGPSARDDDSATIGRSDGRRCHKRTPRQRRAIAHNGSTQECDRPIDVDATASPGEQAVDDEVVGAFERAAVGQQEGADGERLRRGRVEIQRGGVVQRHVSQRGHRAVEREIGTVKHRG